MSHSLFKQHVLDCFDEDKPFYPLVAGYMAQLHGHLELSSRAIVNILEGNNGHHPELVELLGLTYCERAMQGEKTPLHEELRPVSKVVGRAIQVDLDSLAADFHSLIVDSSFREAHEQAAGSLFITAKAFLDDYFDSTGARDRPPIIEFLRHCRNAAAHGGTFNPKDYDEPKAPAEWRGIVFTEDFHGENLFHSSENEGHLKPGDAIFILWDIEQQHPDILSEHTS